MGERATHLMRDSPPGRGQGEKRRERERGDGLIRPLEVEARGPVSSFLCPPPHQRPLTHARTPSPPSPTHTSRSTPSLDAPRLWMLARPRTKPASSALDGRPGVARGAPAEGGAAPGAVAAWSARGAGAGAAALGGGTSWADAAATRRRSRQAGGAGHCFCFCFAFGEFCAGRWRSLALTLNAHFGAACLHFSVSGRPRAERGARGQAASHPHPHLTRTHRPDARPRQWRRWRRWRRRPGKRNPSSRRRRRWPASRRVQAAPPVHAPPRPDSPSAGVLAGHPAQAHQRGR